MLHRKPSSTKKPMAAVETTAVETHPVETPAAVEPLPNAATDENLVSETAAEGATQAVEREADLEVVSDGVAAGMPSDEKDAVANPSCLQRCDRFLSF